MEKTFPVITISREYASYGRTIAIGLSNRLGIPYYDKDFVRETAKQSGYSEEDIKREGETMSRGSKIMNTILNNTSSYTSSYDAIFRAQKEVVLKLGEKPCIIIGRCADSILQEAGVNAFKIFLYADIEFRKKRALELAEDKSEDIEKVIEKVDEHRKVYYKQYTGKEMGDYKNYNICLDVGRISVEKCIDIVCEILEQ